jgi:heme exporter protein CcmD
MNIDTLFNLQGHGAFVWGAYAPVLIALVAEAWLVLARLKRARAQAGAGQ